MGRRRLVLVVLGLVVVATTAVGGWAAYGGPGPDPVDGDRGGDDRSSRADGSGPPPTDNTVTRIEVHPNGSARWVLRVRTRLDSDRRVEQFRTFQQEVENDREGYLGPFRTRIDRVVSNAGNETGREMRAEAYSIDTGIQEVPRRWGVVTYEFRWTNFARQSGDELVVGDVFQGGFFLAANDTLTVVAPADYAVDRVEPTPDDRQDGELTWEGETDFADGRPRATFVPEPATRTDGGDDGTTTATTTDGVTATDGTDRTSSSGVEGLPLWPLPAVLAVVVLGGLLGYVALGLRDRQDRPRGSDAATAKGGAAERTGRDAGGNAGDPPVEDGTDDGPDRDDAVILTDEDRVERLLESRGGQMHQSDVADELDWSSSKTSRVLSGMADEGRIEKIRIGRQNVIRFPEDEDDADDRDWSDV